MDKCSCQTLDELRTKIHNKFNIYKSTTTISNYIKLIKYKRKRTQIKLYGSTFKKYKQAKKEFERKIRKINKNDIICIDESYINGSLYIKYGWCKRNQKLIKYIPRNKIPQKRSLIMAISNEGIIHYELLKIKGINKELFKSFLETLLKGIKNKYILMDNVNFHKCKEIKEIITNSGNNVIFIPPYSPEYNPIEEVFSQLKNYIRKNINYKTFDKKINKLIKNFSKNNNNFVKFYDHAFN